jgi:cytochrome d ubiquinol oxidase subunit II
MLDYTIIRFVWWLAAGALLIAFAIVEGHDLGAGTLLPFVARNDNERRVLLAALLPRREGQQVWFVTTGAALLAAWPQAYAVTVTGLYPAVLALLWALFLRPVGFVCRSKLPKAHWRMAWDWGLFAGSALPPLVFGITLGNLLTGVPFSFDTGLHLSWHGHWSALLNPFALLGGGLAGAMQTMQGAAWLLLHCEGKIEARARQVAMWSSIVVALLFVLAGFWVMHLPGYVLTNGADPAALGHPLAKSVLRESGAWLANYRYHPLTRMLPILALLALLMTFLAAHDGKRLMTFLMSSTVQLGVIGTAGVSMYPFVLPSSSQPNASLTLWDAAANPLMLNLLFWGVLLSTPLLAALTNWGYRLLRSEVRG